MNEKLKWLIKPVYFRMQKALMIIPDELFIKMKYRIRFGKKLNLKNPTTYNEKLNWLKLYNRNPEYTKYADKVKAKEIAGQIIGYDYIIPTIGTWDNFDDIDFNTLPDKFVLKCSHDSGSYVICKDKAKLDYKWARKKLNSGLKRNFYWAGREKQYDSIPRKILAEPLVGGDQGLSDYKFFVFDGKVKAMYIATDRVKGETKFDFFDKDFNHLDFINSHPNASVMPSKPAKYDEMVNMAERLGKGFPHIRIDFYECDGKVYFGEFTFCHMDGMQKFVPENWDYEFGKWIDLSSVRKQSR